MKDEYAHGPAAQQGSSSSTTEVTAQLRRLADDAETTGPGAGLLDAARLLRTAAEELDRLVATLALNEERLETASFAVEVLAAQKQDLEGLLARLAEASVIDEFGKVCDVHHGELADVLQQWRTRTKRS